MSFDATLLSVMNESNSLTPRLVFQVDLENRGDRVVVLGITGDMSVREKDKSMGLASLNTLFADATLEPGRRYRCTLYLDLNHRQVEIIEEKRRGGDVQFTLNLTVLSARIRGDNLFDRFFSQQVGIAMPRWGVALRIPQSEWVKMLDEMGYERLRVIELPIPTLPEGTVINSSLRYVEEALKSFNQGDYPDVLGDCRKAIEEIERANLDLKALLESESKAEKIDGVNKKVKDYLNLGPHAGIEIDRMDAEAALYFTISIIRYLARRLQKS